MKHSKLFFLTIYLPGRMLKELLFISAAIFAIPILLISVIPMMLISGALDLWAEYTEDKP